jgi:hypothetical protein
VIEYRDAIFDEVPTHGPTKFPLLLTSDSTTNDSQHVSVDLSPSHYDVGLPLNPTSVSPSTLPTMTRQTDDDDKDLIYVSSNSNPMEISSIY